MTYTYDKKGNITKIVYSTNKKIRYVYDDLGQLIREDNGLLNKIYVYTYDNVGNIKTKVTYALTAVGTTPSSPTSTYNYGYSSDWGDNSTEISLEQTYSIFGKEVTFSAGVNTGLGASFSFGKKTVIGATYGWGLVFSLEVK